MLRQLLHLCALATTLTVATAVADQNDPRLEVLFEQLQMAPDAVAAAPIEELIWQIWLQHEDAGVEHLMQTGIDQMNAGQTSAALATFTQLVSQAPDYAEGWNKRATLYYLLGDYARSELDIQQTLALEPFHFGALSGRGLVKMGQRDYEGARRAMLSALEVHPNMESVKSNVQELDDFLRRRSI
jgi:Flp pilus assembly protein TadD